MVSIDLIPNGSGTTLTIPNDDIVSIDPVKTHTGVGDFRVEIKGNRSVEDRAARQDRINFTQNGETFFTGYLTGIQHDIGNGNTGLEGKGIAKKLEETRPDYETIGGPLVYENIALQDAIRDYWTRTPFDNVTVTDQDTTIIADDEVIRDVDTQTEWENAITIADTDPFAIQTGSLVQLQSCFNLDARLDASADNRGVINDPAYVDGAAAFYSDAAHFSEFEITPEYDIPAEEFGLQFRIEALDASGVDVDVLLDGQTLNDQPLPWNTGALVGLDWYDIGFFTTKSDPNSDLEAGTTYTLRFEVETDNGGNVAFDRLAVFDERYESGLTFDNTVDANQELSGPELYPLGVDATTDEFPAAISGKQFTLQTDFNDTSNAQAIASSNDGGSAFVSASNTETLDDEYANFGRSFVERFTLSGFGTRTNDTPTTGFNAQQVNSYTLTADVSDLVVIDELELSRNHFDNLQTLHDYGDFLFTIEHDSSDIDELVVQSYPRGEVTQTLPERDEISSNPEIEGSTYYNTIPLQGREVGGDRPFFEADSPDDVTEDGRTISPGILRDLDIGTEVGAEFRARGLLAKATEKKQLKGQKTYPIFDAHPGYATEVTFNNDTNTLPVEEIQLRKNATQATATLDFVPRNDLSRDIEELRRQSRETGDQI